MLPNATFMLPLSDLENTILISLYAQNDYRTCVIDVKYNFLK